MKEGVIFGVALPGPGSASRLIELGWVGLMYPLEPRTSSKVCSSDEGHVLLQADQGIDLVIISVVPEHTKFIKYRQDQRNDGKPFHEKLSITSRKELIKVSATRQDTFQLAIYSAIKGTMSSIVHRIYLKFNDIFLILGKESRVFHIHYDVIPEESSAISFHIFTN